MFTDAKWEQYRVYGEQYKLRSIWSMFEVDNLDDLSGITATRLLYKDHWGKSTVSIDLPGGDKTWGELWHAADKAILESGDDHHVFIESLDVSGDTIVLRCGS